jgi:hypothetical protein
MLPRFIGAIVLVDRPGRNRYYIEIPFAGDPSFIDNYEQWTFDEVSNGIYNITNAEPPSYRLEASISSPPPGFTLRAQRPTPGTTQDWKVLVSDFKTF